MGLNKNKKIYKVSKVFMPGEETLEVSVADLKAASRILKPTELIVWLDAMSKRGEGAYVFDIQTIVQEYGISRSSVQPAFNNLLKKGFIEHVDRNRYYFHSRSQSMEYVDYYEPDHYDPDW